MKLYSWFQLGTDTGQLLSPGRDQLAGIVGPGAPLKDFLFYTTATQRPSVSVSPAVSTCSYDKFSFISP